MFRLWAQARLNSIVQAGPYWDFLAKPSRFSRLAYRLDRDSVEELVAMIGRYRSLLPLAGAVAVAGVAKLAGAPLRDAAYWGLAALLAWLAFARWRESNLIRRDGYTLSAAVWAAPTWFGRNEGKARRLRIEPVGDQARAPGVTVLARALALVCAGAAAIALALPFEPSLTMLFGGAELRLEMAGVVIAGAVTAQAAQRLFTGAATASRWLTAALLLWLAALGWLAWRSGSLSLALGGELAVVAVLAVAAQLPGFRRLLDNHGGTWTVVAKRGPPRTPQEPD